MRFCKKWLSTLACGLILLSAAFLAQAAEIGIRDARLSAADDAYTLSADFSVPINPRLEEAIGKGVVVYFTVEFELTRARWYWFSEQVAHKSRTFQLSYHALTRQYRLSTGALHQQFNTLDQALLVMSRMRSWSVVDKAELRHDQLYQVGLRMYLDLSQMPKTFQVSALANKDWNLQSDWQRWKFQPSEAPTVTPAAPTVPAAPAEAASPAPGEAR